MPDNASALRAERQRIIEAAVARHYATGPGASPGAKLRDCAMDVEIVRQDGETDLYFSPGFIPVREYGGPRLSPFEVGACRGVRYLVMSEDQEAEVGNLVGAEGAGAVMAAVLYG